MVFLFYLCVIQHLLIQELSVNQFIVYLNFEGLYFLYLILLNFVNLEIYSLMPLYVYSVFKNFEHCFIFAFIAFLLLLIFHTKINLNSGAEFFQKLDIKIFKQNQTIKFLLI